MKTKEKIKFFSIKKLIKNLIKKTIDIGFDPTSSYNFYCVDSLRDETEKNNWKIGKHSYSVGKIDIIDAGYGASLEIGSFTSISKDVTIILANHKINNVTTYPFLGIKNIGIKNIFTDNLKDCEDHSVKGNVTIGSDVWIGAGATILPGVSIGHGSVIGAKAVVTKNVPPYAVCVGNPAKIIKFRFSESVINKLLKTAWWDIPDDKLAKHVNNLTSENIETFISEL